MQPQEKSKQQLMVELEEIRRKIAEFEPSGVDDLDSGMALGTELNVEQKEYLEAVKISGDALLSLINDILDFSKMEAGKFDLMSTDFSLRDCLGNSMSTLASQAHKKKIELAFHVLPETPDKLNGDPGRLRQILVNLIGNAIKFTEKGEVVVRVEPESESENHVELHFKVTDTGVGIPANQLGKIFRAFEQVDSSSTRVHGGTGLGLTISSQLVELMEGRIWVESKLGVGSTFHFTARFGLASQPVLKPVPREISVLGNVRVIIVDDNATNRTILEETVRSWGMLPTAVADSAEAMAVISEAGVSGQPFSLALVDFMMPGMNGFEATRLIREKEKLTGGHIPIIAMTAHAMTGDREWRLAGGMDDYISKPINRNELSERIEKLAGGNDACHRNSISCSLTASATNGGKLVDQGAPSTDLLR